MTIEEKISFLSQVKIILLDNNSWLDGTKEPIEESFDAAIKSLEAWGKLRSEIMAIGNWRNKSEISDNGVKDCLAIIDRHTAEIRG